MATRDYSDKQEKHIAKVTGGKVQRNSGGTKFGGGDVHTDKFFRSEYYWDNFEQEHPKSFMYGATANAYERLICDSLKNDTTPEIVGQDCFARVLENNFEIDYLK